MPDGTVDIVLVRPSLLGTYGDGGNATVLAARLRRRGLAARVIPLEPPHPVPRSCDIVVLGGGEDDAQVSVADDVRLRASIVAATAAGASILAVCGGYQLLGASFLVGDGREVAGFDIFDWRTDRLRRRAVGEVVADSLLPGAAAPLTGFENHGGRTVLGPGVSALGAVRLGVGNGVGDVEGAVQDRMVATYLHGPVLARNPQLADHLLELVVGPLAPLDDPPVDRLREERLAAGHRRGRWPRRRGPAGS